MKSTPAFILKNCAFWADNDVKVGQIKTVSVPLPKEVNESFRNAGMIKDRKVAMGYELPDLKFTMSAFDPATISLMTGQPGDKSYMVTGAFQDEDGTTHSAVVTIQGRLISQEVGDWAAGKPADLDCEVTCNFLKLEIDGAEKFQIDDFDYVLDGVSQTGDIRSALLLT